MQRSAPLYARAVRFWPNSAIEVRDIEQDGTAIAHERVWQRFTGRSVVLTGAAQGLGRGTAAAFLAEGANLILADIDGDKVERTAAELDAGADGTTIPVMCDVSREDDVRALVERAVSEFGAIDHLVNNAGTITISPLIEITEADWDRVIDVNLKGVFFGMKCTLPHMLERGSGSIVNIASQAGKRGNRFIAHYNASKAGVISLTQTAALEAAPKVRVNCVCPGVINTDLQEQEYEVVSRLTGKSRDAIKSEWIESMPLGRFQEVEDVADAVLFLASDESRQTTGEALNVSGGMVME
jgi:meso-butanediol dehydrogenase/(S,S)-butanediol dehydrogenase/diacetyl reductase